MVERSKLSQTSGDHSIQAVVNAIANTVSDEVVIWVNDTDATVKITEAAYTPDAAVTGDDTNNLTLQIRNKELVGVGTVGVTAIKTYSSGVDIIAFDKDALVLSTTDADLLVDAGEVLTLNKAETGTGLTMPQGVVNLTYQFT